MLNSATADKIKTVCWAQEEPSQGVLLALRLALLGNKPKMATSLTVHKGDKYEAFPPNHGLEGKISTKNREKEANPQGAKGASPPKPRIQQPSSCWTVTALPPVSGSACPADPTTPLRLLALQTENGSGLCCVVTLSRWVLSELKDGAFLFFLHLAVRLRLATLLKASPILTKIHGTHPFP